MTPCAYCRRPVTGKRADACYCSTSCRQKAYRQRHKAETRYLRLQHEISAVLLDARTNADAAQMVVWLRGKLAFSDERPQSRRIA